MYQIGYFFLTLVMITFTILAFRKHAGKERWIFIYVGSFAFWTLYLWGLGKSEFLMSTDLPPRMPMMVVFPVFILIAVLVNRSWFNETLSKVSWHHLIYIQSFRIVVELIIYSTYLEGISPARVTYHGLNQDVWVGLSAPIFGFLSQKNILGRQGFIAWNMGGLGILAVTVYSFISYVYFIGPDPSFSMESFGSLPFLFLPGFLMPLAVFVHVISLKKAFQPEMAMGAQ